ncbi:MAG: hypothetical protein M3411_04985 [Chloroflexota bacterium]|nr:hypothetical protein [Chloroflexota bacterium]
MRDRSPTPGDPVGPVARYRDDQAGGDFGCGVSVSRSPIPISHTPTTRRVAVITGRAVPAVRCGRGTSIDRHLATWFAI